jgi:hypothetical protein
LKKNGHEVKFHDYFATASNSKTKPDS